MANNTPTKLDPISSPTPEKLMSNNLFLAALFALTVIYVVVCKYLLVPLLTDLGQILLLVGTPLVGWFGAKLVVYTYARLRNKV